jgi:type II secretion system protein H
MSRAGKSSRSSGFSLLELIVVLAILSVCVALVAPGLNPERFTDSMKTGIRRFSAILAQARNEAMVSGERQTILVDYSRQGRGERVCYRLLSSSAEKHGASENGFAQRGEDSADGCFPSDIRVDRIRTRQNAEKEGKARFAVLPNGLIQPGLIFLREGERKRTLRIRPHRVYPEILKGHPEVEGVHSKEQER